MAPSKHLDPTQAGVQITRDGYHWGTDPLGSSSGVITYAFRQTAGTTNDPVLDNVSSFSQINRSERVGIESALHLWSEVANISFSGVDASGFSDDATMLFGNFNAPASSGAFGAGYYPGSREANAAPGDVWLNVNGIGHSDNRPGTYDFLSILHEIGHAIGLQHPGVYNSGPGVAISYAANAEYVEDSRQYTVMSYFDASWTGANHGGVYASTPLLDDITAIQRLYGANTNVATGDTVYGFHNSGDAAYAISSPTQQVVYCVWDGGGNDTLDFSGYATNQKIDLNAGAFSDVGSLTRKCRSR